MSGSLELSSASLRMRLAGGHAIVDKAPMFTADDLWTDSSYPQPGVARCRISERMQNETGRELVRVTVAAPDGLEMLNGESEILSFGSQILEEI